MNRTAVYTSIPTDALLVCVQSAVLSLLSTTTIIVKKMCFSLTTGYSPKTLVFWITNPNFVRIPSIGGEISRLGLFLGSLITGEPSDRRFSCHRRLANITSHLLDGEWRPRYCQVQHRTFSAELEILRAWSNVEVRKHCLTGKCAARELAPVNSKVA